MSCAQDVPIRRDSALQSSPMGSLNRQHPVAAAIAGPTELSAIAAHQGHGESVDSVSALGHGGLYIAPGESAEAGGNQLLVEDDRFPAIVADSQSASPLNIAGAAPAGDVPFQFDWDASFANLYEPQGELAGEPVVQPAPRQGFDIPQTASVPIQPPPADISHTQSYSSSVVRSPPLSLSRTGSKRKADPETAPEAPSRPGVGRSAQSAQSRRGPVKRVSRPNPSPIGGCLNPPATAPPQQQQQQAGSGPSNRRGSSTSSNNHSNASNPASSILSGGRVSNRPYNPTTTVPSVTASGRNAPNVAPNSFPEIPNILPHEKVFPIQIGSELFRLSGASISSDAPSYFSQFFQKQLEANEDGAEGIRTLYIDRDPVTFKDISMHLQGYHIQPRDGSQFVRLFADAQFYSLPKLISQLFDSEIFIRIGQRHFQIPRDIFSSPGDSPNFFSLGYAIFFSTPSETFPGLNREGLLRPPSILPPSVPNRCADIFAELLHMLRGYPLYIRNDEHRMELLRDCRYFHLRGLEQKLIPHHISFNCTRDKSEITIRIQDIRPLGLSFINDALPADRSPTTGWVNYMRPFVDETSHELVLEIGEECTKINFHNMRATFHGETKARIAALFQVVANKMNLATTQPLGLLMMAGGGAADQPPSPGNTPLSEDQVKIRIDAETHVLLDGEQYAIERAESAPGSNWEAEGTPSPRLAYGAGEQARDPLLNLPLSGRSSGRLASARLPLQRRYQSGSLHAFGEWVVKKGQWRLGIQPSGDGKGGVEVVLVAVKLDALSGELGRNAQSAFLC
ncbi:MAG: hypothetical protein M1829_006937 [Trizodia sp. TS-e1964]|nr:MAG: hypothetical protein M1829_006937 [Trizodia sp. TS-e1964]